MDQDASQSQAQNRRVPRPRTPKLKDSCTACGLSKLRCSKDKPTCKRCEARGLQCEYNTSKRTGRISHATKAAQQAALGREQQPPSLDIAKFDQSDTTAATGATMSSQQQPAPVAQMVTNFDKDAGSQTALPSAAPLVLPSSLDTLVNLEPSAALPSWSDTWMSQQYLDDFAAFPDLETETPISDDWADIISSVDPFITSGTGTKSSLSTQSGATLSEQSSAPASILMSSDEFAGDFFRFPSADTGAASQIDVPMSDTTTWDADHDDTMHETSIEPNDCCVGVTVNALVRMSIRFGPSKPSSGNSANNPHYRDSIVDDNRIIINELLRVLGCECSQDVYLIGVISLVVLKAMSLYEAAIQPDSTHQPRSISRDHPSTKPQSVSCAAQSDREDSVTPGQSAIMKTRRESAQLVLGELHKFQRLVNLISQRIDFARVPCDFYNKADIFSKDFESESPSLNPGLPLSMASLVQMEADLRTSLGAVSAKMIEVLRTSCI